MSEIRYNNQVLNQRGTPSFFQDVIANRPSAGVTGRIFISTDTFVIQRDTGSGWVNVGGAFSGTGAAGQVAFFDTATSVAGDNGLFWNNTNKRLGIGTNTPSGKVDIHAVDNNIITNATINVLPFAQNVWKIDYQGANKFYWYYDDKNIWDNAVGLPKISLRNAAGQVFIQTTNQTNSTFIPTNLNNYNNLYLSGASTTYGWGTPGSWNPYIVAPVTTFPLFAVSFPALVFGGGNNAGLVFDSAHVANPDFRVYTRALSPNFSNSRHEFICNAGGTQNTILTLFGTTQASLFAGRVNVNGATDNSLFELNNNGNLYTGGLSPTILTITGNTTMARTVTGYYCTATLTLTLPSAAGLNNIYWIIAGTGATITINRAGTDDILNLAGTSVTSITLTPNQRCMLYVGGGTRTFLISQA